LTEQVEVKTHEEDEDILFKLCVKSPTTPFNAFDLYLHTPPGAPSCSGSRLRATNGRKEELETFVYFSTKNLKRFV